VKWPLVTNNVPGEPSVSSLLVGGIGKNVVAIRKHQEKNGEKLYRVFT